MAARYLVDRGYEILERNPRSKGGEIDIVARHPDGDVVFVEVRTRRGEETAARVLASVDRKKQQRLLDGAAAYLAEPPDPHGRNRRPGST